MKVHTEIMGPNFEKHWLEIGTHRICLHHFKEPDVGDHHNHPLGFMGTILRNGYVEEYWDTQTSTFRRRTRMAGDRFFVNQSHIHRIVELIGGDCITSVEWQEGFRHIPCFFRLKDGVLQSRPYNQPYKD